MRSARFEIVRTEAGWFARFLAANHKEVWRTSETYARRRGVENAIEVITGQFLYRSPHSASGVEVRHGGDLIDVLDLDERLHKVARPTLPALDS